jgi:CIC family chloride channel protein
MNIPQHAMSFLSTLATRVRSQVAHVQPVTLILLASLVGVITGAGAIVFAEMIDAVQWLAIGSSGLPLYTLPQLAWYHIMFLPALGGLLVALIVSVAHGERGHGVPEVMESVALKSGKLRPKGALIMALTSALTIGTGGSVGREGPIVHIGASLGSLLGQILRVPASRLPALTGCGVAGGIAAVFNAPIAGAFFALEVIMGNFAMPAFGPIMLASVVATVTSRMYFGDHPAFLIPAYTLVSAWELGFYLLLGIACGIGGVMFMFILESFERIFSHVPIPRLLRPALGGLMLGGIVLFVPNVYGIGYATMDEILRGAVPWTWLLLLLPVKMGATSLTLASGGSGGLFLPSLYLGSIIGGLWGIMVGAVFPTVTGPSGGYALVGMAAFLAGVVHCPITAFLLLFELSTDYHIILPLMVSCSVSTLIAKLLRDESIYTLSLIRRGVDVRHREANLLQAFTVDVVMRREVPVLEETTNFTGIVEHFLSANLPICFVTTEQRQLRGEISIHDVKSLFQEQNLAALVIASDLSHPCRAVVTPEDTLARCLELLVTTEQEYLPVNDKDSGILLGIVSYRDLLQLYNREIFHQEYLGLDLRTQGQAAVREDVRLPHDYTISILQVPTWSVGNTLTTLQLRTRFGLTVVAIRKGGLQRRDELPDPNEVLVAQDYLVVVGREENIQDFRTAINVPLDTPHSPPFSQGDGAMGRGAESAKSHPTASPQD